MSFLSKLFGKKQQKSNTQVHIEWAESTPSTIKQPTLHLKGKPDKYGLYPSELIMLSLAEKFTTNESNFPSFLTYTYEISNPLKMLQSLNKRNFLEIGKAKDYLQNLKLTELKEISTTLNIVAKGKKAEIVAMLSSVSEDVLANIIKERTWKLTDLGIEALKSNPYIQYFLDKHNYNIAEVGVNIWTINEEFVKPPTRPYRDIIYHQLNNAMNEASIQIQTNPSSGTNATYRYCECYRLMGLFIEEEGRSYINAADMYFQYLFKKINIHAGLNLLINWKTFNKDKAVRETLISRYYDYIQIHPYEKVELLRLLDKLDLNNDQIREKLIISFKRARDIGIMSETEAADFIILELSGEFDKSRELAYKLAKKAVKNFK